LKFTLSKNSDFWVIITLLAIALVLKIPILANPTWSFSGDEGIVGLMAKHILEGSFPIYFYGQAYWGSFEACIASFFFLIFGINPFALKLAPLLLFLLFIISQYFLVKMLFNKKIAFLSAFLSAIAPSALNMWSSKAGSHIANLFLGTLFFLLCFKYFETRNDKKKFYLFLIGIYTGFSYWTDQMLFYYLIPLSLYLFYRKDFLTVKLFLPRLKTIFLFFIPGFFVGVFPEIYYRLFDNTYTITASAQHFSLRQTILKISVFFKLFTYMTGYLEKQSFFINILTTLYLLIIFASIAFGFYFFRKDFKNLLTFSRNNISKWFIVYLQFIFVPVIFILTPVDPNVELRTRLLLPLYTFLPVILSILFFELKKKYKSISIVILSIILLNLGFEKYNFYREWGLINKNLSIASFYDEKENLIKYLKSINAKGGYASFWLGYEITFRTNEKIIIYPLWGRDKYPKYFNYVMALKDPFYIYHIKEPYLVNLESKLKNDEVKYSKKEIGNYVLFYNLSMKYLQKPLPKNKVTTEFWGDLNPQKVRIN